MNHDETKQLFALIDAYWPNRLDIGAGHVDAWATMLAPYAAADVIAAIENRVHAGDKFVPMLPEIVAELNQRLVPTYAECKPWFRRNLPADCPPAIRAVIDAMGGPEACGNAGDPDYADERYLREHGNPVTMYANALPRAAVTIGRQRRDALGDGGTLELDP